MTIIAQGNHSPITQMDLAAKNTINAVCSQVDYSFARLHFYASELKISIQFRIALENCENFSIKSSGSKELRLDGIEALYVK